VDCATASRMIDRIAPTLDALRARREAILALIV
jgi:hypothetical protein